MIHRLGGRRAWTIVQGVSALLNVEAEYTLPNNAELAAMAMAFEVFFGREFGADQRHIGLCLFYVLATPDEIVSSAVAMIRYVEHGRPVKEDAEKLNATANLTEAVARAVKSFGDKGSGK